MKIKSLGLKGLMLAIVVILSCLHTSLYAQLAHEERKDTLLHTLPQEQKQVAINYDDEIRKNEIPETIASSVENSFTDHTIKKAYRGSDGSYKLVLEKGDEKLAAFYDARGEFSRLEELNEDELEENRNDDWR
jgi:hypothetical protein